MDMATSLLNKTDFVRPGYIKIFRIRNLQLDILF